MPYVGSSVDESTKQDWEEYLEQSSYGSMSELVRGSVRKEIQSDGDSSGTSGTQTVEVDRLKEQQQDTIQKIENLREVVEEAQKEREKTEYPEDVVEAAHNIAGELDTVSQDEPHPIAEQKYKELRKLSAEHFGDSHETDKIEAALNYLDENVSWIVKRPVRPSEYYRRED
ncbi:hypothetical protein PNP85_01900 [Halobacterium salinarum]|uniref:hypothetical protein n=1 Tax=Halobacterium salinarum TaxID=2242 RepID=UPI00255609EB|nr:hypothetical protein [Halobacterium salinarum]MDL0138263.1 hypothetical protein [Halobacterium salinarum]